MGRRNEGGRIVNGLQLVGRLRSNIWAVQSKFSSTGRTPGELIEHETVNPARYPSPTHIKLNISE